MKSVIHMSSEVDLIDSIVSQGCYRLSKLEFIREEGGARNQTERNDGKRLRYLNDPDSIGLQVRAKWRPSNLPCVTQATQNPRIQMECGV
jgi:hypothetical protein